MARNLLSHTPLRLAATAAVLCSLILASSTATAAALPPSTWVALTTLPGPNQAPVFALAVNPANDQQLIAGNGASGLYRSNDGGTTWKSVHPGAAGILTVAFSPFNPALVLAGTQGGAFVSTDGGTHWAAATGLENRKVRAFAFARTLVVAGTDHGVYTSDTGAAWSASGLATTSIDAVSVAAVNPPVRLVAGGDGGQGAIPLYQSLDGGSSWAPMNPAISGTIVTRLASGPLPPTGDVRPLVVGTNAGLFISTDNGKTFTALSGGQRLPSTDYTQIGFTATHFDRFFVASDGGGGESGGLWSTADSGQHFSSLQPPLPSVTALAVSGDEQPILYVATFRASDHAPMLWAFRDTGGTPQGPATSTTPTATAARTNPPGTSLLDLLRALFSSQIPYVALGVVALLLIVLAVVSQLRSRRR
jgi:photosystem II stability/assembly factor-like uncharacterized protein